jgi:hypothetical protein
MKDILSAIPNTNPHIAFPSTFQRQHPDELSGVEAHRRERARWKFL